MQNNNWSSWSVLQTISVSNVFPNSLQPTPLSARPQCSCKAELSCLSLVAAKDVAKVTDMMISVRALCVKLYDTSYLWLKNLLENVLTITKAVVNENFEIFEPKDWFLR